jgi:hypothetical protein
MAGGYLRWQPLTRVNSSALTASPCWHTDEGHTDSNAGCIDTQIRLAQHDPHEAAQQTYGEQIAAPLGLVPSTPRRRCWAAPSVLTPSFHLRAPTRPHKEPLNCRHPPSAAKLPLRSAAVDCGLHVPAGRNGPTRHCITYAASQGCWLRMSVSASIFRRGGPKREHAGGSRAEGDATELDEKLHDLKALLHSDKAGQVWANGTL